MQGAFIQAMTHQPPRLLGRLLLPFSPWHGLVLEAAASPYLIGGIPKLDDMVFGVWVCSHKYTDGWNTIRDPLAARKWGASLKHPQFAPDMITFADYINAAFNTPEYWSRGESGSLRAPYWWHCAAFAMRELGMTEAQAWDYPIARIVCHASLLAERKGDKDLISADDIKGMEVLREDKLKAKKIA